MLLFETTWINPEGIMLSKINVRQKKSNKANIAWSHLNMKSKNSELTEIESRLLVTRFQGVGEMKYKLTVI